MLLVVVVLRVGVHVPAVIALHARWGERAPELTRSTSLHIVIGSVIQHFENIPARCGGEVCHSASLPLCFPWLPSSSLPDSVSSLRSAALIFHANVLWCDSHVSEWLRTTKGDLSVFSLTLRNNLG